MLEVSTSGEATQQPRNMRLLQSMMGNWRWWQSLVLCRWQCPVSSTCIIIALPSAMR
uniref:Alternative protein DGKK n=1 Tax=Homo sapiens TaxID=9606 RepID=L8EC67_HUMAN|nr:alternative protein DGKK [Homo sapiens]